MYAANPEGKIPEQNIGVKYASKPELCNYVMTEGRLNFT